MLDEAPGLRFLLSALRVLTGVGLVLLAIGLVTDVRIEEIEVDCGFGPVAAVSHDEPACRVDGRNQTLGALAAGALGTWLLVAGRRERRGRRRAARDATLRVSGSGLDVPASEELRGRCRRGWTLALVAVVGVIGSTVVAVEVDAEPALAPDERNAVITAVRSASEVQVSFQDGGRRREAAVAVDPDRALGVGDGIRVQVVGPDAVVAVAPHQSPGWPVLVWLAFLVLLGVAAHRLWRTRQIWRILERSDWRWLQPVTDLPDGSPGTWMEDGAPITFETTRPRPMPIREGAGEPVEVAAGAGRLVVVRAPGEPMRLAVRRPVPAAGPR